MERNFKALKHGHIYVDPSLLSKGIYESSIPTLYIPEWTLEALIKNYENVKSILGLSDSFFDNLKQCELVDVTLLEWS